MTTMLIICILTLIIALALSSIKISPILFTRVTSILFLYAAVISYNAVYIQSIGSGLGIFSGLFQVTLLSQSLEIFFYLLASLILIPMSLSGREGSEDSVVSVGLGSHYPRIPEYSLILLFTTLGGSLLVSSADLVSMYLSIELQSFAVYILATIYRDSESATSAGLKYFLLGGLSSCLILLGSGLIYTYTGLTNLESIYCLVSVSLLDSTGTLSPSLAGLAPLASPLGGFILGLILTVVGFLFKIAAAPFHNWAPDVYDDVPTIVTTWLTIMPKLSILIFLLEIQSGTALNLESLTLPALEGVSDGSYNVFKNLLLLSSLLSLIIGTVVGLAQYRIKRLLAFSTISHVGFLLLALAVNTEGSIESFIFYLVQYSLTNLDTFFILLAFAYTVLPHRAAGSDIELISELEGLFYKQPLLSLSFAICLFSMAGIPPLLGFFGKQAVLYSSISNGYYFLSLVAIIVSVISASYYLKIIKVIFFSPAPTALTDSSLPVEGVEGGASVLPRTAFIQNLHSFVIATLTLWILLFFIKPSLLLNSIHLLALSLYNF